MNHFRFFILLSFLFLAACSTISLNIPGATIEAPTVAGKGKKELGPSVEPAREIEYTDAASARPPNLDNARAIGATHTILHQARFGLAESFEIGAELGVDDTESGDLQTAMIMVFKYQFIGPNKKNIKAGDFTTGLFTRLGWVSADGEGNQSVTFGPGGFPWSADVDAYFAMGGLSLGYQVANPLLLYVAGSYQQVISKLKVEQSAASDNSDPGGTYERDRNGHSTAFGLGMQLRAGKVFYFHGKVMMFSFIMDGIEDEESVYAGGGFHFYF